MRDYLRVDTITAGDAVAGVLTAEGVRHVFGLPGPTGDEAALSDSVSRTSR